MARSRTTLLQGTLDLIVLQLLRAEPTNGYDLMLRIQAISRDVLSVNAGSLYPAPAIGPIYSATHADGNHGEINANFGHGI